MSKLKQGTLYACTHMHSLYALLTACKHHIAAEKNGNKMLETYHKGAYGSRQPDEWSCCERKGRDQKGCTYTVNDEPVDLVHQPSTISSSTSSPGEPSDQKLMLQ